MSAPRAKFERQNGDTQDGGREDEGVLLSCWSSSFVRGFGWFSPKTACPTQPWGCCHPPGGRRFSATEHL